MEPRLPAPLSVRSSAGGPYPGGALPSKCDRRRLIRRLRVEVGHGGEGRAPGSAPDLPRRNRIGPSPAGRPANARSETGRSNLCARREDSRRSGPRPSPPSPHAKPRVAASISAGSTVDLSRDSLAPAPDHQRRRETARAARQDSPPRRPVRPPPQRPRGAPRPRASRRAPRNPARSEYMPSASPANRPIKDVVAVGDEHDHHRIGAREVVCAAGGTGALPSAAGSSRKAAPQRAQNGCVSCQARRPRAVASKLGVARRQTLHLAAEIGKEARRRATASGCRCSEVSKIAAEGLRHLARLPLPRCLRAKRGPSASRSKEDRAGPAPSITCVMGGFEASPAPRGARPQKSGLPRQTGSTRAEGSAAMGCERLGISPELRGPVEPRPSERDGFGSLHRLSLSAPRPATADMRNCNRQTSFCHTNQAATLCNLTHNLR